ncbi:MAG TPA: hypothetical protein VNZ86_01095, partial [Bacteroidia bacterium]|nr:hypothetical protein [Bacteroidia bacterium]
TNTKEGITVSEFYTAKDFPVFVDKTDLVQKKYRLPILIPFIGMQSFNNMGFTQGYLVELNDMHGKAKSVATYSANANLNDGLQLPITKVEYFYNTKNAYTPNGPNYLNSQVTVLDANATTSTAEIGKNVEFFVDKREHSNTTSALTLQGNLDASVFICTLTAIPNFEWSEAMFRSVVTNKVVTKNGILMETHAYDQGSMVVTKNLMFDSETGTPLLTTVTNDYNNPVYTYNYSAQWAYDNMGGAYKNYRAQINVLNSSGINSVTSATTYLTVGDELSYVNGFSTLQRLWVKSINPSTNVVVFMDETGSTVTLANNTSLTVLRSGRRNMQSVQNGVIVSLYNPLNIFAAGSGPFTTLFAALTTAAQTITSFGCQVNTFSYTNPCTGQTSTLTISFTTTDGDTRLNITDGSCTAYIDFHDHTVNCATIDGSTLTISGSDVTLSRTGYSPIGGTWVDTDNCWAANCNTVLHASATRYNDNWTMNYADAQSPQVLYLGHSTTSDVGSEVAGTGNLYRLGQRGIWRQESNYLYQIDRIRSNPTNISWDGMYNKFVPYDWTVLQAAEDLPWTLTSRVSQYSPYGFELENKDTLGIYSSALYGYTNTLPAAVVKNSHNMEMAFDGFEDYPAGNPYPAVQLINGVLTPYTIGHIPFTVSSTSDVFIGNIGHSGNYGLVVNNGNDAYYTVTVPTGAYVNSSYPAFTPQAGQDYNLSVWVINTSASHKEVGDAKVTVYNGSSPIATYITSPSDIIVEGWHKIDLKFTAPASGSALKIDLTCTGGSLEQAVFDDFRLQPFTSSMKSYVYDPITLWLKAELDDRNFATFYNYDELGALVQVKKETEKGVVTIKSSRNNTHH